MENRNNSRNLKFRSRSFIKKFTADFQQQLAIPDEFSYNLKENLSDKVALEGPSRIKWTVGLVRTGDTLYMKHGWEKFVKDHSLAENDVLMFTYERGSFFRVVIFDRGNSCEKEASYFVGKYGNWKSDCGCSTEETPHSSVLLNHNSSPENAVCVLSEKSTDQNSFTIPREHLDNSQLLNVKVHRKPRTKFCRSKKLSVTARGVNAISTTGAIPSPAVIPSLIPSQERLPKRARRQHHQGFQNDNFPLVVNSRFQYRSNRRPVTEEEKRNTLRSAKAAMTNESFMLVMQGLQVYGGFYKAVPTKWFKKHMLPETQPVTLCVKDAARNWNVKCHYYDNSGTGRFTCGWKDFALDNNLEEFDVCVFKPNQDHLGGNNTARFDVSIFRVVEEVIPPTKIRSNSRAFPVSTAKRARKLLHLSIDLNADEDIISDY